MNEPQSRTHPVCAVTVTYGDRRELVRRVVGRLGEERVARVVVVANGAGWDVGELQEEFGADFVDVVVSEDNLGSAGGFRLGLERARGSGLPFLLMLDDDNLLARGGVGRILAQYDALGGDEENVLVALRMDRGDQRAAVVSGRPMRIEPNSFLGFRLRDLPAKLLGRLGGRVAGETEPRWQLVPAEKAPYGGLFLSAVWLERCGLPDDRMYLYADDLEYTMRLRRSGAAIHLFAGARIEDIDASWNQAAGGIASWLAPASPDMRVYYSIRNHVWVEQSVVSRRWVYYVNTLCYLLMLLTYGLLRGHRGNRVRLRLIFTAVRDGLGGRLDRRV